MRKIKETIFVILINLNIVFLLCACNSLKEDSKIAFRYSSGTALDYDGYCYYTDDYFLADATEYNPSLSTCSLALAMSSFASNEGDKSDYSNKSKNTLDFMNKTGFSNIYVNEYFKKKPETDSFGVVIGKKKLDDYTLLCIGLRGANYQQEWASNVTVGDGSTTLYHQGFKDGSDILLNELNYYIETYNVEGKIKIWSAGFSRASAINNITMGRIDKAIYLGESILPNSVNLKKEDIYAYCFEVPKGANFKEDISPKNPIYNNIHNILNVNEPVPQVPMAGFGFTRYGVDVYLPNPLNDDNYQANLAKIKQLYNSTSNAKDTGEYMIDKFTFYGGFGEVSKSFSGDEDTVNFLGGLYFNELLSGLINHGLYERSDFKALVEEGLREVFKVLYQKDKMSESLFTIAAGFVGTFLLNADLDYMMDELVRNPEHFVDDLLPFVKAALMDDELLIVDTIAFTNNLKDFLKVLVEAFTEELYLFFPLASPTNLKCLAQAHYPNVCLANLMAMDKNYTINPIEIDTSGAYYKFTCMYSDDLEVEIYTGNTLVANMNHGGVLKLSNYSYGRMNDRFVAYLPVGKEYYVKTNEKLFYISEYSQYLEDSISVAYEETLEKEYYHIKF